MKFEEILASSLAPEWKSQYLAYKTLKQIIYIYSRNRKENEILSSINDSEMIKAEADFYESINIELEKIDNFYNEKLAEATRKFSQLTRELRILKQIFQEINGFKNNKLDKNQKRLSKIDREGETPLELIKPIEKINYRKKFKSLKYCFTEFYLSVVILLNYHQLNYTGFRKILKKHDKEWKLNSGKEYFLTQINTAHFHTDEKAQEILSQIEELYIREFSEGDRSKGMSELRVPPLDERDSKISISSFIMGFCSSAIIILLAIIIIKSKYKPPTDQLKIFKMFRGQLLMSFFIVLVSLNIYTWRHCGVNHVLIFEIDPRYHIGFTEAFAIGTVFVLVVFICGCGYVFHRELSISATAFPLASFLTILFLGLNPINIFYRSSRFFLIKAFLNNLMAGFVYVRFVDFWLGDQMTSLVGPLKDLHFMACSLLLQDPDRRCNSLTLPTLYIVGSSPYYIRGMQCLRRYWDTRDNIHLANMVKYFTSIIVEILTAIYHTYIANPKYYFMVMIPRLLSSTYLTVWDIGIDWSLLVYSRRQRKFKWRKKRIYKKNYLYILAFIIDIIMRYYWLVSTITIYNSAVPLIITESYMQFMDAFRRFIWNFYRVENEHLNNVGKFRTVRDISIKPLIKENLDTL